MYGICSLYFVSWNFEFTTIDVFDVDMRSLYYQSIVLVDCDFNAIIVSFIPIYLFIILGFL